MPLKLLSPGGGSVLLQANTTSLDYTLTVPAVTANVVTDSANTVKQSMLSSGLAGTGPAFSAYVSSAQSMTHNAYSKVQFNAESIDTANCYDTSLYRFTPNVAGYYQINLGLDFNPNSARAYYFLFGLYKNGGQFRWSALSLPAASGAQDTLRVSCIAPMNGSTDYLESYCYIYDYTAGTTVGVTTGVSNSEFSGFLARAL
jgi:hypothetical protein